MSTTEMLPPGVVPNYVDPEDHKKQTIVLHAVCLTLITLAICMRIYTRAFITKSLGWDDFFATLSWAMSVSWSAVLIASREYGIGRHLWDIPPDMLVQGLKFLFVTEIFYIPLILCIKICFFTFFFRVFGVSKRMRWFILFGIVANVIFYVIVFFRTLFLCSPIELAFNPALEGHCGPEKPLPYATGVWAFISDFYIFFLPMPCVWGLNMKTRRKAKLMAAFSVGLFACIASIIRFVFTLRLVNDVDATWNYITLSIWSVLEVNVGLICACLLALPAFFEKFWPDALMTYFHRLASYISASRTSRDDSHGISLRDWDEASASPSRSNFRLKKSIQGYTEMNSQAPAAKAF